MNLLGKIWYVIKQTVIDAFNFIAGIISWFINFIGPVEGAIVGCVNEKEFYRVITTASTLSGGAYGITQYVYSNAGSWISDENALWMLRAFVNLAHHNWFFAIFFALIIFSEYHRRKRQGVNPS